MSRRVDRRAACPGARHARTGARHARPVPRAAALRQEVRALRGRIDGLWSAALLGDELAVEDVHAIALTLSTLRLRIEALSPDRAGGRVVHEVAMARDDVACCVVTVSDLVAFFAAA